MRSPMESRPSFQPRFCGQAGGPGTGRNEVHVVPRPAERARSPDRGPCSETRAGTCINRRQGEHTADGLSTKEALQSPVVRPACSFPPTDGRPATRRDLQAAAVMWPSSPHTPQVSRQVRGRAGRPAPGSGPRPASADRASGRGSPRSSARTRDPRWSIRMARSAQRQRVAVRGQRNAAAQPQRDADRQRVQQATQNPAGLGHADLQVHRAVVLHLDGDVPLLAARREAAGEGAPPQRRSARIAAASEA